jgi:hypothetical protein
MLGYPVAVPCILICALGRTLMLTCWMQFQLELPGIYVDAIAFINLENILVLDCSERLRIMMVTSRICLCSEGVSQDLSIICPRICP